MPMLKQELDKEIGRRFIETKEADALRIALAMCRNTLSHNESSRAVIETLTESAMELSLIHNAWSQVIQEIIILALDDINKKEYLKAYRLIDLIHNLTKAVKKENWRNSENESFFMRVELTGYIEGEKDNERVKKILSLIIPALQ
jgi:hypothetical protein